MSASADAGDNQSQIDSQFAEYLTRIDRGETIDRAKFLREYSGYAEELRELMDVDDVLRRVRLDG